MNYSKLFYLIWKLIVVGTILLYTCMTTTMLYGQEFSSKSELRKSLNHMFEHIDRRTLPTGLLRDFAVEEEIDWIGERLTTSILGPKIGYEGALYSLSSSLGGVIWSSNNTGIATITSDGKLSIKGKGIVVLTAIYNNQKYSQTILVGFPRFILSASHEPGGYKVNAECIDAEFKEYLSQLNGLLKFNWGVKYPRNEIRWFESDKSDLMVQLQAQNEKVSIFLEVVDALGNKSSLQHININSQDVYISKYQTLQIDSKGILYRDNNRKYSYTSARLYLSYNTLLSDKYKGREWMPITAVVISPFSGARDITVRNGGPLIKDILSIEELEIIKNNSKDNQTYIYMIILRNLYNKAIQFIPVSFTYKTTI